jgi:hypothetical protein
VTKRFRGLLHTLTQCEEALVNLGLLADELLMNLADLLHLLPKGADRRIAINGRRFDFCRGHCDGLRRNGRRRRNGDR